MKKKSIILFGFPLFAVLLGGCSLKEVKDKVRQARDKVVEILDKYPSGENEKSEETTDVEVNIVEEKAK